MVDDKRSIVGANDIDHIFAGLIVHDRKSIIVGLCRVRVAEDYEISEVVYYRTFQLTTSE